MDLLIIGGTRFVGRHLVDAALARGDRVTLFNRGQSVATPPPGVRWLQGDRRADLARLADVRWDAVVDTCAYQPADVATLLAALGPRLGRYALVSSISVYADSRQPNAETAPLAALPAGATADSPVTGDTYGPLKALCEARALALLGPRALLLRPGLIVGPHDPTQRFSYWPARWARAATDGQPVLAPGPATAPVQWVDARDLAAWLLHALHVGASGAVNLVVPPGGCTMADVMTTCAQVAGAAPALARWAPGAALQAQGLAPWQDLPLWLPDDDAHAAFMAVPSQRAADLGLQCRPLAQTVADTLAWWQGLPVAEQAFSRAGLAPERESAVLAALAATGQLSGAHAVAT